MMQYASHYKILFSLYNPIASENQPEDRTRETAEIEPSINLAVKSDTKYTRCDSEEGDRES